MEIIYDVLVVWLMSSVALGVGASSLAITSFLTALYDGEVDVSERRMLKVIYWALRWSMVMIAVVLAVLQWWWPNTLIGESYLWVLIVILYVNAMLMTEHLIPVSLGPALQAATWYTLGFMITIELFNLAPLTLTLFGVLYLADVVFFVVLVNVGLWWLRKKNVQ